VPRTKKSITVEEVKQLAKKPGTHRVDHCLYLQVKGGASWLGRHWIKAEGKDWWPGYGPFGTEPGKVSLADARARRDADLVRLRAGYNPVEDRKQKEAERKAEERPRKKFKQFAESFIADHERTWLNPVHRKQWPATLKAYAYPLIGDVWLDEITTEHAVSLLRPIWYAKAETARRVRARCERVMDAGKVLGLCSGANPFRLAGNISLLLPRERKQKRKMKHHPALDYKAMPEFMTKLRTLGSTSAKALEFLILCWVRTGDIIGQKGRNEDRPPMMWKHVDLDAQIWTIPATKTDGPHKVPLSNAAMAVLRSVKGLDPEIVFPSPDRKGRALSNGAMSALLDRLGRGDITVHGMRSCARDWAAECTHFPSEVCEMALAHVIESDVEAAYRRGDLFVKRRHLMEAWAGYCAGAQAGDNVVDLPVQRETA
jgi:integrase